MVQYALIVAGGKGLRMGTDRGETCFDAHSGGVL